jgi:hypothetical protein
MLSNGGGGGIRTHETLSGLTVFKTAGVNRFPTPPQGFSVLSLHMLLHILAFRAAFDSTTRLHLPSKRRAASPLPCSWRTEIRTPGPFCDQYHAIACVISLKRFYILSIRASNQRVPRHYKILSSEPIFATRWLINGRQRIAATYKSG